MLSLFHHGFITLLDQQDLYIPEGILFNLINLQTFSLESNK